jgi:hypothetical protein
MLTDEATIVAVSDPQNLVAVARELGPAAAECLVRCMSSEAIVGIMWGTAILAMVDALPFQSWPGVTIVQMLGGLGPVDAVEHSTALAQRMAQKFSARDHLYSGGGSGTQVGQPDCGDIGAGSQGRCSRGGPGGAVARFSPTARWDHCQ